MEKPTPEKVKKLRERVRKRLKMNITESQDKCAEAIHSKRRSWQQWEAGDRQMHLAFWELINIKEKDIKND